MADSALNRLEPTPPAASPTAPDGLPERLRSRYLSETRGDAVAYFRDSTAAAEAFRDDGRRLSTTRNDPHVVRDLVTIAAHRGWATVQVRGTTDFRREAWRAARQAGLEVRGYQPTERDEQDLLRRTRSTRGGLTPAPAPDSGPTPGQTRLRVVEAVVRNLIVEPAEQERILDAARRRLAHWLERDAGRTR